MGETGQMIGRIVGLVVGAVMALTGFGMLKPHLFARYYDFSKLSLGPFAEYQTLVCWMIVALGAVVALAALQRTSDGPRRKRAAPAVFAPAEPEFAPLHAELSHPEPAAEAEHGDDHGHHDHDEHEEPTGHAAHAAEPEHVH
jgi:hypothetical protein